MADETENIKALTSALSLRPYVPERSPLRTAGQTLIDQSRTSPVNTRQDYYGSLAQKLAGALIGGFGRQEEIDETQQAYGRLARALNSPDPGSAIAQDPYWYDAAPSFLLNSYQRKGRIDDETSLEKMKTGESQARQYLSVDPETKQTSFYPGFTDAQEGLNKAERTGTLQADLTLQPQIERAVNKERVNLAKDKYAVENPENTLGPDGVPRLTPKLRASAEDELSKTYSTDEQVKQFTDVDNAFRASLVAYKDKGPASDLTFYYNVIKSLDPNAVREGEMGLVRASGGLAERFAADLNRMILNKESLDPIKRQSLLSVAQRQRDSRLRDVMDLRSGIEGKAQRRGGLDVKNVFLRSAPPTTAELFKEFGLELPMQQYKEQFVEGEKRPSPLKGMATPTPASTVTGPSIHQLDASKIKDPVLRDEVLRAQGLK